MNNTYKILIFIVVSIMMQQRCDATESSITKNFSNTFKKTDLLKLNNRTELFTCHALGLFFSGYTYQQYKNQPVSALTYTGISFFVCPIAINSYKALKTKAKHWILEHSEIEQPRSNIKKK